MLRPLSVGILGAIMSTAYGQAGGTRVKAPTAAKNPEETAIRTQLAYGFETTWNSHQPAPAVTADKCIEDAIFITLPEAGSRAAKTSRK
jgi:hypothetical protein